MEIVRETQPQNADADPEEGMRETTEVVEEVRREHCVRQQRGE